MSHPQQAGEHEPPLIDRVFVTDVREDDKAFVLDTWARAFRVAPGSRPLPTSAFHPWHRKRMTEILERESTIVLVAREKDAELFIHGYGVFERFDDAFVAHWVYTKSTSKREKVASLVLKTALERVGDGSNELLYTHRTYFAPKAESMGFQFVELEDLKRRIAQWNARAESEASQ